MKMDEETLARWIALGDRIAASGPDKLDELFVSLADMVEALEIIARFDEQLFLRGGKRPTKRYQA